MRWTIYVPNSQSDRLQERGDTLTAKVVCPTHLVGGDTVHYVWPIAQHEEEFAHRICQAAKHILALGWGIDLAVGRGDVTTRENVLALGGERWAPWKAYRPGSRQVLRIPMRGTLQDYEKIFTWFRDRFKPGEAAHLPWQRVTVYDTAEYLRGTTLPPRPICLFEFDEASAVKATATVRVAMAMRQLVGRVAEADQHTFPGGNDTYVGKRRQTTASSVERFSYLPLPTIGHPHADGRIRRVLLAEPYGARGQEVQWARNRLLGSQLELADGGPIVLLDAWRPSTQHLLNLYVAESKVWGSVTPVVLPRFDGGDIRRAENLFVEACEQAGIPAAAIHEVTLRKAPLYPGAEHPANYHVPPYLQGLPRWHVRITFRDDIPGPLAVGAGRYIGCGVFAHATAAGQS